MTITHPLLRQVTDSLKRTNELRGQLAVKAAVLRDAALELRTGADAHLVGAASLLVGTALISAAVLLIRLRRRG